MIGKAIYNLLKSHISDLATGGIYPVVIPQNSTDLSSSPAIVYNIVTSYEGSKNSEPDMTRAVIEFRVISNTYKKTDDISKSLRYLLDNYRDQTFSGLDNLRGYVDYKGSKHNLYKNIDIADIFYQDQEDDYIDDLFLYSRSIVYNVYYYDNINKFCLDYKDTTNPLILSIKADASIEKYSPNDTFKSALISSNIESRVNSGGNISRWYNSIGDVYSKSTPTSSINNYINYMTSIGSPKFYSTAISDIIRPRVSFQTTDAVCTAVDSGGASLDLTPIDLSLGALLVFIYRPTVTEDYNFLSGDYSIDGAVYNPSICISHKKIGSDITLEFNPRGDFASFSSETISLTTSTDSTNYWDADLHFLALSVGGNKAQTGGSYNQSGWYEYFNSNLNNNLTIGEILEDNTFTGNSVTYSNSCNFASIGGLAGSAGFDVYEFLLFVPSGAQTHGINADAAPFQPTDIIYKKVKDYIYKKYKSLK